MKKYILSLACVGLLGMVTSCDSNLDVTPKNTQDIEQYFKNESQLELFSNNFYSAVVNTTPYSAQDDHKLNKSLSSELLNGYFRTVPASGGGWTWTTLRKINTLIEYAPRCEDQAAAKKFTALARFFRAYFYFERVKRFGDVPWIDHQLFSDDAQLYAARDSRELVMTHMIEDIDFAIENLPDNSEEKNVYRATKGAALALKSRFCLFEGTFRKYHGISLEGHDWRYYLEQCVDASEKLMSGNYGKYALYNTGKPDTDYRDLFTQWNASDTKGEYILAVGYSVESTLSHSANDYMISQVKGNPSATRKFVASFLMKDGSRFTDKSGWQTMEFKDEMKDRDPRLAQCIRGLNYKRIGGNDVLAPDLDVSQTGYQPIKFVTTQMLGNNDCDRPEGSKNDMPVFRYAEVLLNYAEAKAELGTLTSGDLAKSVNLIRKRAGMPDMTTGNSTDPFLTSADYGYFNCTDGDVLEIRRERAIELFMEGLRYYDLIRWKCGKCIDQPIYGIYVSGPCQLDMTGDGKANVAFYAEGTTKPSGLPSGCIAKEINKDIFLSDKSHGYICNHMINNDIQGFDEDRDYYYPIPLNEISLNPNLVQNPGWSK